MDVPIVYETLVTVMNDFRNLRDAGQPSAELLAARFCLTGIAGDSLTGITTTPDLLSGSNYNPHIRRDLDSVLGYSPDIPVRDAINYFAYPNPARTLERRVHVKHSIPVHGQVSTLSLEQLMFRHLTHRLVDHVRTQYRS